MDFLTEYIPPEWARKLKNIPKYRVQLSHKFTPIHRWHLPDIPAEFSLSIKRDDMNGSTLSGNKVCRLEFLMADALSKNCKHVITCGSFGSNNCRTVAICARQLGLKPHLILREDIQVVEDLGCQGNLLLDRLSGAKMYLTPGHLLFGKEIKCYMEQLSNHLKSTKNEDSYFIPLGGSNTLGLFGYISAFDELVHQGVLENFDDIVLACGSGETATGLAVANYLMGSKLRIHGITVGGTAKLLYGLCDEILNAVGLQDVRSENILNIIEGYNTLGYGVATQEDLDFISSACSTTGIVLDPVYTGKAAHGLVKELNTNSKRFHGNRILFIHTGGIFGLYGGQINETLKTNGSMTHQIIKWTSVVDSP